MLHHFQALLAPAVMDRLTLAANHVLDAEPAAQQRLRVHAGRCIDVHLADWPSLLPAPPALAFRITPAGLLEWCGTEPLEQSDLRMRVAAGNPAALLARALAGRSPEIDIDGDAALAGDVNWLVDNLRWDVEADLERAVGPHVAQPLAWLGRSLARALRATVQGAGSLVRSPPP